jgi:hypothetical protein
VAGIDCAPTFGAIAETDKANDARTVFVANDRKVRPPIPFAPLASVIIIDSKEELEWVRVSFDGSGGFAGYQVECPIVIGILSPGKVDRKHRGTNAARATACVTVSTWRKRPPLAERRRMRLISTQQSASA